MKLSRLTRLGSLTTRIGSSYVGQALTGLFQDEETRKERLDQLHRDNAERMVSDLGSLKGAAMKVGQAVAQLSDNLDLPPDVRLVLGKLHDRAEPVPFEVIRKRVESELNAGINDLFTRFDPEPLGTASLGQAHAARLKDGTEVVVKVLHSGIEDSVSADLSTLKMILIGGRFIRRPREELDAIFEEIEERLKEELNYEQEAANIQEFRRYFAGNTEILIPNVFPGWSTRRVLTMERLSGRPLPVFVSSAPEAAKQRAGLALGRAFLKMQYVHCSLHSDPHPGNFLFQPDGRVGLLDFGCIRRFDRSWMASYGGCGLANRHQDREACMQNSMKIGALIERSREDEDALWDLCLAIGKPFRGGPFQMGGPKDDVQELVTKVMPRIMLCQKLRSPRELVFLHRALTGMHQILKQLKATQDWGLMFDEHVGG